MRYQAWGVDRSFPYKWMADLAGWLYRKHSIEIPVIEWEGRWLIRPSVQGYNRVADLDLLVSALRKYLKS